jgi:hypothetical protein
MAVSGVDTAAATITVDMNALPGRPEEAYDTAPSDSARPRRTA